MVHFIKRSHLSKMNNIWCIFFIFALSILIFKSTCVKSSLIIGNGRIQTRVLLSWSDRSVNCATDTSGALKNVNLNTFFNNGPFPAALFFNFVFSIQLTVDWIRTADLWCWKRPLYQLSHNHGKKNNLALPSMIICDRMWSKKSLKGASCCKTNV